MLVKVAVILSQYRLVSAAYHCQQRKTSRSRDSRLSHHANHAASVFVVLPVPLGRPQTWQSGGAGSEVACSDRGNNVGHGVNFEVLQGRASADVLGFNLDFEVDTPACMSFAGDGAVGAMSCVQGLLT